MLYKDKYQFPVVFIENELDMKVWSSYQRFFNTGRPGSDRRRLTWAICGVITLVIGGFVAVSYPLQTTFLVLLAASILTISRE
jgi:hypothetical protein